MNIRDPGGEGKGGGEEREIETERHPLPDLRKVQGASASMSHGGNCSPRSKITSVGQFSWDTPFLLSRQNHTL